MTLCLWVLGSFTTVVLSTTRVKELISSLVTAGCRFRVILYGCSDFFQKGIHTLVFVLTNRIKRMTVCLDPLSLAVDFKQSLTSSGEGKITVRRQHGTQEQNILLVVFHSFQVRCPNLSGRAIFKS